jgi:hypothetical protein
VYIHCLKNFAMVFNTWIYCTLIRLIPSITLSSPDPHSLLFKSFQCILLCHLHTRMQCISTLFILRHSLFFSCLQLILSYGPPITNIFNIYLCNHVCVSAYIYLLCITFLCTFTFHMCEIACNLHLSAPGWLCLT